SSCRWNSSSSRRSASLAGRRVSQVILRKNEFIVPPASGRVSALCRHSTRFCVEGLRLLPWNRPRYGDAARFVGPLAGNGAVKVVGGTAVPDDGGLVGVRLVDRAGRADVDEDLGRFGRVEWVVTDGEEVARLALAIEAVVEEQPTAAIEKNAGVAGEAVVGGA